MKKSKIKFGKKNKCLSYIKGDDFAFPILVKDKNGKWVEIGEVVAMYEDVGLGMAPEYRISEYTADLWVKDDLPTITEDVLVRRHRFQSFRQKQTPAAAKKELKLKIESALN
tara:strand:- start:372 stop:707 length:336 start_codon:yes stop_codon:yes gene_type:complete